MSLPNVRSVPVLHGAANFRDLGGYQTGDDQRTRFGRVFRSNSLQELTASDLEILRRVGLVTVLDLRSPDEVAQDGRGPLENAPIGYVNVPLLQEKKDYPPGDVEVDLVDRYVSYLELAGDSVVKALQTIADEDRQPLVLHCSAGKDRTGVIAALLLSCLGVDSEAVVADYAAKHVDKEMVEFLRRRPSYAERLDQLPPSTLQSEPGTMRQFLALVEERYGGPRDWAIRAGIGERTLHRLRETMLEPTDVDREQAASRRASASSDARGVWTNVSRGPWSGDRHPLGREAR